MDQQKTGAFLKALRKEKGITQEKLAEVFGVSSRTVSRWETGVNMPDLSMLAEIADYYDVDIREIIDGERKSENMDKEIRDTIIKAAEYTDNEKAELLKKIRYESLSGTIALAVYLILKLTDRPQMFILDSLESAALIIVALTPIMITLYTSGILTKMKAPKPKHKGLAIAGIIISSVLVGLTVSAISLLVIK